MTVTEDVYSDRERKIIYTVVAVVLVALMVIGLLVFRSAKSSEVAEQKATQLAAALTAAGARAPTQEQIVRVLGDDGGALCDDPSGALHKSILLGQMMNGAAGPGMRPVIADNRVVKGQLLVLRIYCPDQLPSFQDFVDGLKLDNTVKG